MPLCSGCFRLVVGVGRKSYAKQSMYHKSDAQRPFKMAPDLLAQSGDTMSTVVEVTTAVSCPQHLQ